MKTADVKRAARGVWDKLNFGLPVIASRITRRVVPFQVQMSLTNRCNLKCSYCYADYPHRAPADLTTEQVFRLIDELVELGTRRFNLVGGEPTLRHDFDRIVDRIKGHGLECAVTTNGYYARRKLESLRRLDLACISLDGDREGHDATRGAGSWAVAFDALHLLRKNGVPLQIACVLNRHNLGCIGWLLELGRELGIAVGFTTLIAEAGPTAGRQSAYAAGDDDYRRALRTILDYKARGYPVLFSRKSLEYALNWKLPYATDKIIGREPDFAYIPCNAGRNFVIVDANGDVYPCPAMVDVLPPLNALEVGMKRALEHAAAHPCKTCHIPCLNDFNLLYSLDPSVILNILRTYRPRSQKRMFTPGGALAGAAS
jgi:MoaA/NifB/PqqE/SkfB family radical SAM enzyme